MGNIEQALQGLLGYEPMALELIQNADDARASWIRFDVRDEALLVTNNELFSTCGELHKERCGWLDGDAENGKGTRCNFHAIAYMGGRSKAYEEEQIGRFGIGFVSVFQITDCPIIRSGADQITLDPLTRGADNLNIDPLDRTEFELRWASTQTATRDELKQTKTPTDVGDRVIQALQNVTSRALLFLRHLQKIEVAQNGRLISSTEITREGRRVEIRSTASTEQNSWLVVEADATVEATALNSAYPVLAKLKRSPKLQIAFPLSGSEQGYLYAFLPTDQRSNLPCHINGDFFPVQTRKAIVLDGGQHSQKWNEMLLATAAAAIASNILLIRDELGADRLWRLLADAQRAWTAGPIAFRPFWEKLRTLKSAPIAPTFDGKWVHCEAALFPPSEMTGEDDEALSTIGLTAFHQDLRSFWNAASALGAQQLNLSNFTVALEKWAKGQVAPLEMPLLERLWRITNSLLATASLVGLPQLRERLKNVPFLLNVAGEIRSLNQLKLGPGAPSVESIRKYCPHAPIADARIAALSKIAELMPPYDAETFASELAAAITSEDDAQRVIGSKLNDARDLYHVSATFPGLDQQKAKVRQALKTTPILWSGTGYIEPERALLPGNFIDPVGHLYILDPTAFDVISKDYVTNVLGVRELTFETYVTGYLPKILQGDLEKDTYSLLVQQLSEHTHMLTNNLLEEMQRLKIVRTRGGTFDQPEQCYFWSAELEKTLGARQEWYVDDAWLPVGRAQNQVRDLFAKLGVGLHPAIHHLVGRLIELTDGTPAEGRDDINRIVREILSRWDELSDDEMEQLEDLKDREWLPAISRDTPDVENWYAPNELYQPFTARGFSSQVEVVDLPVLRNARNSGEFLEFLEMEAEPPTQIVIDHLLHCAQQEIEPDARTYEILNGRVESDELLISELQHEPCVYVREVGFVYPAQVFWNRPPLGKYWFQASAQMRQRESLFNCMGVHEEPGPAHYAALLRLVQKSATGLHAAEDDLPIYDHAISELARLVSSGGMEADLAVRELCEEDVFISKAGLFGFPKSLAWADSQIHLDPFGNELEGLLARDLLADPSEGRLLFQRLGVQPISRITELELVHAPRSREANALSKLLRERVDLLLWVPSSRSFRNELQRALSNICVKLSDDLQIIGKCHISTPPSLSPKIAVPAFFQPHTKTLHIAASDETSINWATAIKAVIAQLEAKPSDAELRKDAFILTNVLTAPSHKVAEQMLIGSEFAPPSDLHTDLPTAAEVGELRTLDDELDRDSEHDSAIRASGVPGDADEEAEDLEEAEEPDEDDEQEIDEGLDREFNGDSNVGYLTPFGSKAVATGLPAGASVDAQKTKAEAKRTSGAEQASQPSELSKQPSSRLKSYVASVKERDKARTEPSDDGDENVAIDFMAVDAAMKYERSRGWHPEEQHHSNPGFDIRSNGADGQVRIIEVKGLRAGWNDRGVKVSPVQFATARENPDTFWLYVVEFATTPERTAVHAIANPFGKVDEYWFDDGWRAVTEESISGKDLLLVEGARLTMDGFGKGTIQKVRRQGLITYLTIDFGVVDGIRTFPYNAASMSVID